MSSSRSRMLESQITKFWYSNPQWIKLFAPMSWALGKVTQLRRLHFQKNPSLVWNASVPVCVIGNITVGGTGKTPLTVWLAQWLMNKGKRVGIVSRGYGGTATEPLEVAEDTDVEVAGDEALVLARRTRCPVVVFSDRVAATKHLLQNHKIDIVLSDDGLQHYRLGRELEIAVVDGFRGLGNGMLLPIGPLREPPERLEFVDWVVSNGRASGLVESEWTMQYRICAIQNVASEQRLGVDAFLSRFGYEISAVVAIGNPHRFARLLKDQGFLPRLTAYKDHHKYIETDFATISDAPFLITEKDAQKISNIPSIAERAWYVEVEVDFQQEVNDHLTSLFAKHHVKMESSP